MIGAFLWAFGMLVIYALIMIMHVVFKKAPGSTFSSLHKQESEMLIISMLNLLFYFQQIIDSKYVGLIVFLNANIFTGLFNMIFNAKYFSTNVSLLIISLYGILSIGSGCLVYDIIDYCKNKKKFLPIFI